MSDQNCHSENQDQRIEWTITHMCTQTHRYGKDTHTHTQEVSQKKLFRITIRGYSPELPPTLPKSEPEETC